MIGSGLVHTRHAQPGERVLFDLGPDLPSEGILKHYDWQSSTWQIGTDFGLLLAGDDQLQYRMVDVSTPEAVEAFLEDETTPMLQYHSSTASFTKSCDCRRINGSPCGCSIRRTAHIQPSHARIIVAHDTNVTTCVCAKAGCPCVKECDVA